MEEKEDKIKSKIDQILGEEKSGPTNEEILEQMGQ